MMRIWMSLMSGKTTEKNLRSDRNGKRSQNKRDENAGSKKVKYEAIAYDCGEFIDGIHCADITGAPHDQSFKTLVMEGKSGGYYVFVVPIEKEVDRKAAAKSVGEKTVDMIHVKDPQRSRAISAEVAALLE